MIGGHIILHNAGMVLIHTKVSVYTREKKNQ